MIIETHHINSIKIAEVLSEEILILNAEQGFELMINLYYQDFDRIILHEKNISSGFFALETGMAGELLQKFSNYRVRLAIAGDFSKLTRKSIRDFIFESNKGKHVNFVSSTSEALKALTH